ncbi:MAG: hypothetical protein Q7T21_01400 [Gallionella sp.]|nr:hypothetical protein [Gallionella sp.]
MNDKIRQLLKQISTLEAELDTAIEEQESRVRYKIEGKRVVFENAIKEAHRKLKPKMNFLMWFFTVRPQNFLTMPIIYGMLVPLALLDLCISLYQLTCFPIYGIARVKRANYILIDRQYLAYLNIIEKADCMYCGYAVGMIGYASEILARTEQYFCPIKHARKMLSAHARYANFLGYGEADDFHGKLEQFRSELAKEEETREEKSNVTK